MTHDLRRHPRSCSLDGWDRLESTEQWRKIGEEDPDDEAPDRLWSRFHHEQCGRCKKPIDYGALAEVYTPRPEPGNYTTEEEEFQAADDYCNALADRQEQGQFTLYAMYPVCGECASTMILEDVSDFAAPLLSTVRAEPREHLWIAVCIQYEPGAYGKYQPFLIHSYIPTPIE